MRKLVQEWPEKRGGFAGAGGGDADEVLAAKDFGNGCGLNRGGLQVLGGFDGAEDFLAKAEGGEFHERSQARVRMTWAAVARSPRAAPTDLKRVISDSEVRPGILPWQSSESSATT